MKLKSWHIALLGSVLQLAVIVYAIIQYKAGVVDASMFLIVPLMGAMFTRMLYSGRTRKFGALFGAVPSAIFLVVLSAYAKDIMMYVPLVPALVLAGAFYFWKERSVTPAKIAPVAGNMDAPAAVPARKIQNELETELEA